MTASPDILETRVATRFATRLASRVKSRTGTSVIAVASWLDLVDLCRELDDALVDMADVSREVLDLHDSILSLAIGSGTWLVHQIGLKEIDPARCEQTGDSIEASLELLRIMHRSRHARFSGEELEAVRQRIFNAAA